MSTPEEQNITGEITTEKLLHSVDISKKIITEIQNKHNALEEIKLDLVSMGPWSYSKYKSLIKCPFQYYLKHILKIKIPETLLLEQDPVSTNVGKAAHEILENILCGKSVEKAYAAAKKNYVDKKLLSVEDWEKNVDALVYNITKFKDRIDDFDRRHSIKKVLTELRIGLTREFEPTGFFSEDVWLRGVIDLTLILESLDAVILDHKTGGGQGPVKPYEDQLNWYKVLIHFGLQKMNGIQTGVHFIKEGEVKMASFSNKEDIAGHLRNSIEMSLEGAIEMLQSLGYFKHIRTYRCKWCEYDNLGCKSGELKPIELSTKKFIKINGN